MFKTLFKKATTGITTSLKYDTRFEELRKKEYARLDEQGQVYLDYTGGNLYGSSQIMNHFNELAKNAFGNPHSTNPTSQLSTQKVEAAREKVRAFFNAQDYHCIFTSNASGALKIVGECYPFDDTSELLLLADNHNSVNGIREYAKGRGALFNYIPVQYEDLKISSDLLDQALSKDVSGNKLFAFPAQSNVSGVKHDLGWVKKAQERGWDVLLDAAAYVPSNPLDLSEIKPDFVSVSFYKIFGYPTGLGCLLVHKNKFDKLQKHWFAGGTVTLAGVKSANHYLANNHERFENGTIDYLEIPALKIGLEYIESIGMDCIQERVQSITGYMHQELNNLYHSNGQKLVNIYGPSNRLETGGTIIMTFNNPDGQVIPFELVENQTNARNISIRSGCFCNPGLDEINNCLSTEELSDYFTSRDKGNYHDMIDSLKKMRGAVRVSFGLATVQRDLDAFLNFLESLKDKGL